MNLPVCSRDFRRWRLLAAKELLRIAIAPAEAGTSYYNSRSTGPMRVKKKCRLSMNQPVARREP